MKNTPIISKTAIVFSILVLCVTLASAQSINRNTTLTISIKGVPAGEQELVSGMYVVDASGNIKMPMLDDLIKASGLSSAQLGRKIEAAYRNAEIYNHPTITVITKKNEAAANLDAQQVVTIGGQVSGPGPKPYMKNMTIWQAIMAAGGPTPFGSIKRVELHRNGKKFIYDLKDPKAMRLPVYPNDSILVPQKTVFGN